MKNVLITLVIILALSKVQGQDYHYSQQYITPSLLNPSLAGISNCEGRLSAQYRNQWATVSTPFQTMSAAYEQSILKNSSSFDAGFFGVGLILFNDVAPGVNLRTTQALLNIAYHQKISETSFFSFGIQAGGVQNAIQGPFVYDAQFDGRFFNTSLPSGELPLTANNFYLDLSTGLSYTFVGDAVTFNVGAAGFHINNPDVSLAESVQANLSGRYVIHTNVEFPLNDAFSGVGQFAYQWQGPYNMINLGAMLKIDLGAVGRYASVAGNADNFLYAGLLYRLNDAIIPVVKWQNNRLGIGISYDVNVSNLTQASQTYGGLEIGVTYDFGECGSGNIFCPTF